MIIGIDASRANKKERTGTEWYSYYLIKKFSEIDKVNKYILYTKEPLRADFNFLGPNFYNRVLAWPPKLLWSQLRLSWEMLFKRPDILFVPAHTVPLIHPKKTITTCHDIGFEEFPELYSQKKIGGGGFLSQIIGFFVRLLTLGRYANNELDYHRFSMRLAARKAFKIITPSRFTAQEIKKYYHLGEGKISITHLGYDPLYGAKKNKEAVSQVLARYAVKPPFFIFIGRLEEKKNILGLVKSFYIFKKQFNGPEKLVLIGAKGNGWEKAARFIEEKKLASEIIHPGWVSEKEVPLFYQAAQALVFISYYEGFGLPVLEAMASGLPVIASNRGSLPEIIKEAGLLAHPDNHKKIAFYMHQVAKNQALRRKLIEQGLKRASHFSWERCARETHEVITRA